MIIDSATNRNLELIETLREKQKKGSLLWVLDKTKTAMGARLMRNWIEQPLIEKKKRGDTGISECSIRSGTSGDSYQLQNGESPGSDCF